MISVEFNIKDIGKFVFRSPKAFERDKARELSQYIIRRDYELFVWKLIPYVTVDHPFKDGSLIDNFKKMEAYVQDAIVDFYTEKILSVLEDKKKSLLKENGLMTLPGRTTKDKSSSGGSLAKQKIMILVFVKWMLKKERVIRNASVSNS